jgi:isochorismate hydrolase
MKEVYFAQDTIKGRAAEWSRCYSNSRKAASQPFVIHRAGLLILDMQRYFLEGDSHACVPSGLSIIPGLNDLVKEFRQLGRPVIATRHENKRDSAGMMASWWAELITSDHNLVDIHENLDILPNEILRKSQYDAFYQTPETIC